MTGRQNRHLEERRSPRKRGVYVARPLPKHPPTSIPEPTYLQRLAEIQARDEQDRQALIMKLQKGRARQRRIKNDQMSRQPLPSAAASQEAS
jgi:hypothetical protein